MQASERIRLAVERHDQAVHGFFDRYAVSMTAYAEIMAERLAAGHKILACGNGGSACDAMHFAGELVGRFVNDRRPLPAIALSADPGILTAIGNDYGFEMIFSRQVRAHAKPNDLLIAISTSGQSPNILRALAEARDCGMQSLLLTGEKGQVCEQADEIWAVPSSITAHIQETHIMALQLLIALVEDKLF